MTVERSECSVSKSDGPFEGIKVTVADFGLFCIEIEIDGCGIKTRHIVYMSTAMVINCDLAYKDISRVRGLVE